MKRARRILVGTVAAMVAWSLFHSLSIDSYEDFALDLTHEQPQTKKPDATYQNVSFQVSPRISKKIINVASNPGNVPRFKAREEQDDEGMAACMLIMDDNHYLIEWLAYHYYRLPLRRLIMAVDPKSKTSPFEILNRYHSRGLINITIWGDDDFIPDYIVGAYKDNQLELHNQRQKYLILKCLKALQGENRSWVAVIDSDEFVLPNRLAGEEYSVDNTRTVKAVLDNPPSTEIWRNLSKSPCQPMARRLMGVKEPPPSIVQYRVPVGFNASDFMTFRFVYPQDRKSMPGKAMVDLSRIPRRDIQLKFAHAHRALESHCTANDVWLTPEKSPFLVFQYTGTFEQFSFRADGRGKRTRRKYELLRFEHSRFDISATDWLQGFVDQHGEHTAKALLAGIGNVEPFLNATQSSGNVGSFVGSIARS